MSQSIALTSPSISPAEARRHPSLFRGWGDYRVFSSGPRLAALVALAFFMTLSACSGRLGWGVVLWSDPEAPLASGAIVPVYIRSSIEQLFVVGVPGTKKKAELELWRLEVFPTRALATARVQKFGGLEKAWLVATRDGLPVREGPQAGAKRVYRLREGESVKILERVEGEKVTTGAAALQGDWYLVLTADGSRGYAFSNTMRLYDESKDELPVLAAKGVESAAARIDLVFSRSWRPEYFQEMIDDDRVDLDLFIPTKGLFTDAVGRQIRIELPAASKVFNYSSIAEVDGWLSFEGTSLRLKFEGDRRILADWSGRPVGEARLAAEAHVSGSSPALIPSATGGVASPAKPASPKPASVASAVIAESSAKSETTGPDSGGSEDSLQGGQSPTAVGSETREPAIGYGSYGASDSAAFVILKNDIRDTIRAEEVRRLKLLESFIAGGSDWIILLEGEGDSRPVSPVSQAGGQSPLAAEPQAGSANESASIEPSGDASASVATALPPLDAANSESSGSTSIEAIVESTALVAKLPRLSLSLGGRFSLTRVENLPTTYLPKEGLRNEPGSPASGRIALRLRLAPALEDSYGGVVSFSFDGSKAWLDFFYRRSPEGLLFVPVAPESISNFEAGAALNMPPLMLRPAK